MPLILPFTKVSSPNEKGTTTAYQESKVKELEMQLERGSIQAALELTATTGFQQHGEDCYQCNKLANYFIIGFQSIKAQQDLPLNATTWALVTQTIELIQSHNINTNYTWLTILMKELRDFGKRIRDESVFSDTYVPLQTPPQDIQNDTMEEQYGRAIRIAIYHCRATTSPSQSIHYYRKCVSVLPSPFDNQLLQQSAKQRLMVDQSTTTIRPTLIASRTSSTVSSSSSSTTSSGTNMVCANCSSEKKRMPVCSKCKSQAYCSIRCLKSHKPVHDVDCQ